MASSYVYENIFCACLSPSLRALFIFPSPLVLVLYCDGKFDCRSDEIYYQLADKPLCRVVRELLEWVN